MASYPADIGDKIERFRSGENLRVLDLFAGCGGFSLGFNQGGYEIAGGVEIDPHAAMTHAANFHNVVPDRRVDPDKFASDITSMEPQDLTLNGRSFNDDIDVIIGGPPCQAYARVGRAKLREVNNHPEAYRIDPRGNLYMRYLAYVSHLRPLALVMENVPDALNYGGHNVAQEVADVLVEQGYDCTYTILNAVFYGVPQLRDRLFLVAFRKELGASIGFPQPTHMYDLPRGYENSRTKLISAVNSGTLFEKNLGALPPVPGADAVLEAVSAEEALADLPILKEHLSGDKIRGRREPHETMDYSVNVNLSAYATKMRSWPGFEAGNRTDGHLTRLLPRDYPIFRAMGPGDEYPEAHEKAEKLFQERLGKLQEEGRAPQAGTPEYIKLRKDCVPPYDPTKFPNKWRKMDRNEPARTLLAHLGKDSYTHIHYDSQQARTITVREAARLQSFPDGFKFFGSMSSAFRQIGNAVPPILSHRIAESVMETLVAATKSKSVRRRQVS
ncbi:MAG: DNA cytosine methyltransferase [Rhodospirillales bacterium]|nr:DNA cytosine methyltransferase [Rhodospirillales bacterium]